MTGMDGAAPRNGDEPGRHRVNHAQDGAARSNGGDGAGPSGSNPLDDAILRREHRPGRHARRHRRYPRPGRRCLEADARPAVGRPVSRRCGRSRCSAWAAPRSAATSSPASGRTGCARRSRSCAATTCRPGWTTSTLVVASSNSGNTEETISALGTAVLAQLPDRRDHDGRGPAQGRRSRRVSAARLPGRRHAAGGRRLLGHAARRAARAGRPAGPQRSTRSTGACGRHGPAIATFGPDVPTDAESREATGLDAARPLPDRRGGRVPRPVARRWKTQLNENGKSSAAWEDTAGGDAQHRRRLPAPGGPRATTSRGVPGEPLGSPAQPAAGGAVDRRARRRAHRPQPGRRLRETARLPRRCRRSCWATTSRAYLALLYGDGPDADRGADGASRRRWPRPTWTSAGRRVPPEPEKTGPTVRSIRAAAGSNTGEREQSYRWSETIG